MPSPGSSPFDRLREQPLIVESCRIERLSATVATRAWERITTVFLLAGGGHEGRGEDVALGRADHDAVAGAEALARLAGTSSLGEWLERLPDEVLWSAPPSGDAARRSRRWAVESAALDLALRQAGLTLAQALGREQQPMRFVASLRLDDSQSIEPVRARLAACPGLQLKLDPTGAWTEATFRDLAATGAVAIADLKGVHRGVAVDQPPDPDLYERTAAAFPDALLEDPALTPATERVLAPHAGRVAWDAPIRGSDDVRALTGRPAAINVKPSRIGTLAELLDLYDHCRAEDIAVYAGGLFELGPGRRQLQCLASLFHPDAPNDAAPAVFNEPRTPERLPASPLRERFDAPGFAA